MPNMLPNPLFAETAKEAERRYTAWRCNDPFPSVSSSLLTSAEIADYVSATGMVCPFYPEKLKSASYEVNFKGQVIYWTGDGSKKNHFYEDGEIFTLKRNSIAFVQVEPEFRLPNYIALRFNLKITHVYRGLLLGTGPLVDPGFAGRLFIPLHNLTNDDYEFVSGKGLIWMEFTKLNWPPPDANGGSASGDYYPKRGAFVRFPRDKKGNNLDYYLGKASPNRPIRSSLPNDIKESSNAALAAREAAEVSKKEALDAKATVEKIYRVSIFVGVGIMIGLVALLMDVFQLVNQVETGLESKIKALEQKVLEIPNRADNSQ